MAIILSIETSTPVCSAAISNNGKLVDYRESFDEKSHATSLTVFIDELIKQNSLKPTELNAIAISEGPGSYTGLRIGVSVAKGMCYALNKPLIAIDTLKTMVLMAKDKTALQPDFYCAMLDARRMEVYTALFTPALNKIEDTKALVIEGNEFSELLKEQTIAFFGNGSEKCKGIISSPNAIFIDNIYPTARFMSQLAYESFLTSDFKDVAYYEPFYLKDFVATIPKQKVL